MVRLFALVLVLAMIDLSPGCCCATYWDTLPKIWATSVVATGFDPAGAIVMRLRFADETEGLYRYSIVGRRTPHDLEPSESAGTTALVAANTIQVPSSASGSADSSSRFTPGSTIEVSLKERLVYFQSLSRHEEMECVDSPKSGVDWSRGASYAGVAFIFIPAAIDIVTSPIQLAVYAYLKATDQSAE